MAAIVHNSGVNYTLYYNAINYFKTIMSNHPSIATVSQGNISDFDVEQYPAYPVGNINILGSTFGTSTTDYSIQLIVADKQKLLNNESSGSTNSQTIPFYGTDDVVDIHANTLAILNDLTSYTQRSVEGFEINDDIVCEPFSDRFNNGLAGWVSTFTLTVHNDKNRCLFFLTSPSGSGYTIRNCATSQSYNAVLSGSASVGNIFNSIYPDVTSCYTVTGTLTDFDEWDLVNLPVLNVYGSCVACANAQTTTTTSTTTTTAAPTTTTTSTTTTAAPTTTTTSTTSTTTTLAPTTTTTLSPILSQYYIFNSCCSVTSSVINLFDTGSWGGIDPYKSGNSGSVIYNPNIGTCMINSGVKSLSTTASFTITAANSNSYVYGYFPTADCATCTGPNPCPTTTTTSTTSTTTTTAAPTTTTTSTTSTTTTTTSTTTTTTAGPTTTTTTLAPGIYNFYQSVACCDSSSISNVAILSGSSLYTPGGSSSPYVIGTTYYNPTTDRCETISVSSSASIPSFVITAANQGTYVYGSTNTSDTQCNRCAILGAHICSGSICYNWSFQNTNISTARNVYIVDCTGSAQTISVSASSSVNVCSYATPIAEVPDNTIITNLGVCSGTTTTTTTAAPTTTTTTVTGCVLWTYRNDNTGGGSASWKNCQGNMESAQASGIPRQACVYPNYTPSGSGTTYWIYDGTPCTS